MRALISRARAATRLDSAKYVRAPNPPTMRSEATVIENDNLLALLFSKNGFGGFGDPFLDVFARRFRRMYVSGVIKVGILIEFAQEFEKDLADGNRRNCQDEAEQTEDGETRRNDRLIAVTSKSRAHSHVQTLRDLNESIIEEIEHFFISYNEAKGKTFEPIGRYGKVKAKKLVEEGIKKANGKRKR